jgi:hypothetical protein
MQPLRLLLGVLLLLLAAGCKTKHEISTTSAVAPIEIKPIHITIDVNLKVDKELNDFFDDIDQKR